MYTSVLMLYVNLFITITPIAYMTSGVNIYSLQTWIQKDTNTHLTWA